MPVCQTLKTPFGNLTLAANGSGEIMGVVFGQAAALRARLGAGREIQAGGDAPVLRQAAAQIAEYFSGERKRFDLPLAPAGTPFQRRVRRELRKIPFGETRSYGDIARKLKTSARAIGSACGANTVALLVPCHRVIASDGGLSGFAFGPGTKARLLAHERKNA
ncbi:MAG: methylated-DNA--[protein]-cysteine S-methyltransferase [Opitutaceae bacterium]|jgi:methylated-DNA-[protein]-cysteine S-methyltransferase|nr:methylated-DNA--[protein]-cysteine S-methyltransferase [Opitutaceae bacterium]